MEDLEGEDRQPIDDRSGGLRVLPCVGGKRDAGEALEQCLVDLLDRIVAALVVAVDRALVRRDRGIRDVPPPRAVLLVPQQSIVAMVVRDPRPDAGFVRRREARSRCPARAPPRETRGWRLLRRR
jgi:hypothetical protein